MEKRLTGKAALVTGGSTGIGRAIAHRLADEGAKVVITGRHEDALQEAAAYSTNITYAVADVTNPADIEQTLAAIADFNGGLDVLVNNAGIALPARLLEMDLGHFDAVFNVNVRGLVGITLKTLPLLRASRGTIINIASVLGDHPMESLSVYSASKAAVIALTRTWARELAGEGVRVNVVSPGPIETPIYQKMGMPPEAQAEMAASVAKRVPLGRFGTAEEVAAVVAFLVSAEAGYVTGAQYTVDGGFAA